MSVGPTRLRISRSKRRTRGTDRVVLTIEPEPSPWHGELCLRIPDWCRQFESAGDLYRPRPAPSAGAWTVRVNGHVIAPTALRHGYLVLERDWDNADLVELHLPMPIRRITSHPQVIDDRERVALQRGPTVYCIEAVDHGGRTRDIILPAAAALRAEHRSELLAGVTVLQGDARRRRPGEGNEEPVSLLAVPYGVWANRGAGEMDVWLPERVESAPGK